jgi:hypothetical protein
MTMEETRESQQAGAVPAAYQPVYPAPPNPYYAPPVKAGRWVRFRRMCRLILRRLWYGAAVVGRVLRPYAAFVVVVIALLGIIGWMSYLLWGPKPGVPSYQRANAIPPAGATETFMQGQQNFNADMMWDTYSADYQAAQLANGASKATLQSLTTTRHNQGFQYVHYDYIGGLPIDTGSMYFYTVNLSVQNQNLYVPIIFTADADGKIVNISSPLYPPPADGKQ